MEIVNGWTDVMKKFKMKPRAPRKFEAKPMKCNKCGGIMTPHKGTNVFTCENLVEKEKVGVDGISHKVMEPCGNFLLRKYTIN